jgi:hypothetical protein
MVWLQLSTAAAAVAHILWPIVFRLPNSEYIPLSLVLYSSGIQPGVREDILGGM